MQIQKYIRTFIYTYTGCGKGRFMRINGLFLYFYLLVIVLLSRITTVNLFLPYPVYGLV